MSVLAGRQVQRACKTSSREDCISSGNFHHQTFFLIAKIDGFLLYKTKGFIISQILCFLPGAKEICHAPGQLIYKSLTLMKGPDFPSPLANISSLPRNKTQPVEWQAWCPVHAMVGTPDSPGFFLPPPSQESLLQRAQEEGYPASRGFVCGCT